MGRELDVKVAKALGCDVRLGDMIDFCCGCGPRYPPPHGQMPDCSILYYSTDITAAWELDGEWWRWVFEESVYTTPAESFLDVTVWTDHGWFSVTVPFADYPTKAAAYATGRCEAFLLAKEVENA